MTATVTSVRAAPAAPAEFATGWGTVALAVVGIATSVSALLIYSLGTLMVPLERAMGWGRADLQIAVSFLAAGSAISVNLVGWLNLRYGMRAVTAASMLAVSIAFGALSLMQGSIVGCMSATSRSRSSVSEPRR